MLNHRYILEMAVPHTIKHEYSYMRRAAPVMHTYRWKQVAMSNDLDALKKALEGKKISELLTGNKPRSIQNRMSSGLLSGKRGE